MHGYNACQKFQRRLGFKIISPTQHISPQELKSKFRSNTRYPPTILYLKVNFIHQTKPNRNRKHKHKQNIKTKTLLLLTTNQVKIWRFERKKSKKICHFNALRQNGLNFFEGKISIILCEKHPSFHFLRVCSATKQAKHTKI